jgi:hypothetical protein
LIGGALGESHLVSGLPSLNTNKALPSRPHLNVLVPGNNDDEEEEVVEEEEELYEEEVYEEEEEEAEPAKQQGWFMPSYGVR